MSDAKIREVARGQVERGLAAHGWKYVNIDDFWQGVRETSFRLAPHGCAVYLIG